MTQSPASGEQAALAGYRWQYDHIAERVYDALLEGDFVSLRMVDPNVGQADDLVLFCRGRVDAFQFKSGGGPVTLRRLTVGKKIEGGRDASSLARSLAEGWKSLKSSHSREHGIEIQVHLVTEQLASVNDRVRVSNTTGKPAPRHFAAFLELVLKPLQLGHISAQQVDQDWRSVLHRLQEASGLDGEDFAEFIRGLRIDCNAGSGLPSRQSQRRKDIEELSSELLRYVSTSSGVVSLNEQQLLVLMGWTDRATLRSRHAFPVDLDSYEPLSDAIKELRHNLNEQNSGYIALLGPPGTGKSTLLNQALTATEDRVIHYFAFVPGYAPARSRMTAQSFLHDLVLLLAKAGLPSRDRQLVSADVSELRQQLVDQLHEASVEFEDRGVRTIIVVDGLDHVDREKLETDGLLSELPHPGELPLGVIMLVGSRTLTPLRPEVQQFLEETSAVVDLGAHPLSPTSILAICRRTPTISDLKEEVLHRIVALSDGNPLYLNYLLKRLAAADAEDADAILSRTPPYEGDIAGLYRAAWEELEDDDELIEILEVCSRLRIGFKTDWLTIWTSRRAVHRFRRKLLFLFHQDPDGWRFFHDSFRQFVVDRTAFGDAGIRDREEDAAIHARIADFCAQAEDNSLAAEQLHHRYLADQRERILEIGNQRAFREQFQQSRSAELVREDIGSALEVAAEKQDLSSIFRLLLSLAELESRRFALRDIEMPSLLYESGLVDEAISSCARASGQVLLAHAYDLAWRLGQDGNSAGRRIFESFAHLGVDERDHIVVSGHEDDAAVAWTRCAGLYRPLPLVLEAIANQAITSRGTGLRPQREQEEALRRYASMTKALIEVMTFKGDLRELELIDAALAKRAADLENGNTVQTLEVKNERTHDLRDASLASVVGLRVRVVDSILGLLTGPEASRGRIQRLLSSVGNLPAFPSTRLRLAELLAQGGLTAEASSQLSRTRFEAAITVDSLSGIHDAEVVNERFSYWRLRYRLAESVDDVSASTAPSARTPAGDDISGDALIHSDRAAIQMASQIDGLIRDLARIDGQSMKGVRVSEDEAWSVIERSLTRDKQPAFRTGAMLELVSMHLPGLARIAAYVASSFSRDLAQRMSDEVGKLLHDQRMHLPRSLLLDVAESLKDAGADLGWERDVLAAHEASLSSENVHLKLDETSDLIRRHVRAGRLEEAQRLVLGLRPASFAVGFRKDYQFDDWVDWLGRAVADPGGEQLVADAAWLARLLTAVEPMAERAPRKAAADLPASVVSADPIAAVRLFEYLVRRGTVRHLDALAALVQAVVERLGPGNELEIRLAADVIGDLLASAAYQAYPELATALVAAAERTGGRTLASEMADSIASRTDAYALPTSRGSWRAGCGLPSDGSKQDEETHGSERSDTFSLLLSDGTRIPEHEVPSLVDTADDIVSLRTREDGNSEFRWAPVITMMSFSRDDLAKLVQVFPCDNECDPRVIAQLAISAEKSGDRDMAVALARRAFDRARGDTWAPFFGGTRLVAAGLMIRCGDPVDRTSVYHDLARQAIDFSWLPGQLILHFEDLVRTLGYELPARYVWSAIRTYLDGMAQVLDLDFEDPIDDHGCRWWLSSPLGERRGEAVSTTAGAALAELTVGHLSHPSWIIRETASMAVIRALGRSDDEVAQALDRFVGPDASHDMLERAGRCLAGARVRFGLAVPPQLSRLDRVLADHSSQALRDLASIEHPRIWRDLEPAYRLQLPAGVSEVADSQLLLPDPYEGQYEVLARELDLDLDSLNRVATRHANASLVSMPSDRDLKEALRGAALEHAYPLDEAAARRAAFGYVIAELRDANLLGAASSDISQLIRTADLLLLGRMPKPRPPCVPSLPPTGHDQTCQLWLAQTENRLRDYLTSADSRERVLIGAKVNLVVMNGGLLREEVLCGTTIGADEVPGDELFCYVPSAFLSDLCTRTFRNPFIDGKSLIVENHARTFLQSNSEWLAFRPDIATALGWLPDPETPGRWLTGTGALAVESTWWVDGFWGRTGRSFDDAVAKGYVVEMTIEGAAAVSDAFGTLMRNVRLARSGLDDGVNRGPQTAKHSQPLQ